MKRVPLSEGDVLADRFVIEAVAGQGGAGVIFRARDRLRDKPAAIKVLHDDDEAMQDEARFAQEAEIIAELRHPGIVTYEAHGLTPDGKPFLAMEWLEGEDLATRLARGTLAYADGLLLVRRVAEALAAAHLNGVVHRDIKPSNLFLRDGAIEKVTILDFGIARRILSSQVLTHTGAVIGTLEYMAPEQASGRRGVKPSADVFSLGCVLFECLTGRSPFAGEQVVAVLAKILFEQAPHLCTILPEASFALADLLARMLAKDPSQRPEDAAAFLVDLLAVEDRSGESAPRTPASLSVMSRAEMQLVNVVVAAAPSSTSGMPTIDLDEASEEESQTSEIRALLSRCGAQVERLSDGTVIASLSRAEHIAAPDQALQAVRCALVLHARLPCSVVVVTAERGALGARPPVGRALARAGRLLAGGVPFSAMVDSHVWLDELTADLIDARYRTRAMTEGFSVLEGERTGADETRPLLGKPTPCVGREYELSLLALALETSATTPEARVVLITAAPGVGKSRLRHELLRRLGAPTPPLEILGASGDPMSAGASYGLASQALRRLAGITEGSDPAAQRAQLEHRIRRHVGEREARRVAEFLGELCGVPFPDDASEILCAARRNPRNLSDQITRAFVDFLRAECAAHPVLIVLEDLHWGDTLTIGLLDASLRELADLPLMVLGLGRPEIDELFPHLWKERKIEEIRLACLSRKAARVLVGNALGDRATPEIMERIVAQSAGNALYLEELIRAAATGKGDEVPGTVLAMVQSRLMRLDRETRRVLSVGSIFGETFWQGGIVTLLGKHARPEDVSERLEILVAAEVIERRAESRFPEDTEYRVRHALSRDAAYELLDDADRIAGHHLAGSYLESMAERDPMTLAEHYRRGGALDEAIPFYTKAAQQALDGYDLSSALARVDHGIDCGAVGEALGVLLTIRAWALGWRYELVRSVLVVSDALPLLPSGSTSWCQGMGMLISAVTMLGQMDRLAALTADLSASEPHPQARAAYIETASRTMVMLGFAGLRGPGQALLERMQRVAAQIHHLDAGLQGWLSYHALYVRLTLPEPWEVLRLARESSTAFERVGDEITAAMVRVDLGSGCAGLGADDEAEAILSAIVALGSRLEHVYLCGYATVYLSLLLAERGGPSRADDAQRLALSIVQQGALNGSWLCGLARCSLAILHRARSEGGLAEAEARRSLDELRIAPALRPWAFAILIRILLNQQRGAEARQLAEEGLALVTSLGGTGDSEVRLRVVVAEAFHATGEHAAARREITEAVNQVRLRASTIPDPVYRERFLERVPENARALALAQAWSDEKRD